MLSSSELGRRNREEKTILKHHFIMKTKPWKTDREERQVWSSKCLWTVQETASDLALFSMALSVLVPQNKPGVSRRSLPEGSLRRVSGCFFCPLSLSLLYSRWAFHQNIHWCLSFSPSYIALLLFKVLERCCCGSKKHTRTQENKHVMDMEERLRVSVPLKARATGIDRTEEKNKLWIILSPHLA